MVVLVWFGRQSSENAILFDWMVLDLNIPAETDTDVGRVTVDFYEGEPPPKALSIFHGPGVRLGCGLRSCRG